MTHQCNLCNVFSSNNIFSFISHLDNHMRENGLLSIKEDLNKMKQTSGNCDVCNKSMSNYYNYQRHQVSSCVYSKFTESIVNISNPDKLTSIIKQCNKQLESLRKKQDNYINNGVYADITNKGNYVNGNNNGSIISGNNNRINNNNISISLNNLNEENLDILNKNEHKDFQRSLIKTLGNFENTSLDNSNIQIAQKFDTESIKNLFVMLFEEIYFNEKYPENHNIYVNSKISYRPFHVYVNDRWSKEGNLDTIKDIIIRLKDIFLDWITELIHNKTEENPEDIEVRDYYNRYLNILSEDLIVFVGRLKEKELTLKSTKKLVKHFFDVAYKNRAIVESTFKNTNRSILNLDKKKLDLKKKY